MNLKKAVANYLINDTDINAIVWDRVYRNKAQITEETPFIVYSQTKTTNKMWWFNNVHHYLGKYITFDILWKYEDQEQLEEVANLMILKLNWFSWELTEDWSWTIWLVEQVDLYDEQTDLNIVRLEFIFKEIV